VNIIGWCVASLLVAASSLHAQVLISTGTTKGYFVIGARAADNVGSDEVIEFFSYGCVHCAEYQTQMDDLKSRLPATTRLKLVPVVFNQQWEPYSRAFFAAEMLGILDQTHQPLFDLLHGQRSISMSLNDLATRFYSRHGVNPAKFLAVANSAEVTRKMDAAYRQAIAYGVDRTPTLAVNGKYRIVIDEAKGVSADRTVDLALNLVK
jgi:thiol:disulfide interchange protein DsbA